MATTLVPGKSMITTYCDIVSVATTTRTSDVVHLVTAYADAVHDAVRRRGTHQDAAPTVVEQAAVDLVVALAERPAEVTDPLIWWLARAERLADAHAPTLPDIAPLASGRVAAALDRLEPWQRRLLWLRDAYDLPSAALAQLTCTDVPTLRVRLATARLALLSAYDGRTVTALPDHPPVGLGELAAAADATLPALDLHVLHRHVYGCAACEDVLDSQRRARLIIGALPRLGLDPAAHEQLVARVAATAESRLSGLAEILLRSATEEPRSVSPLLVGIAVLTSLAAGVLLGVGTSRLPDTVSPASASTAVRSSLPPPGNPRPVSPVNTVPTGSAAPSRPVTGHPVPTPSPRPTPTPTPGLLSRQS